MTGARYEIEGVTVRFFFYRTEAMRAAVLRSSQTQVLHTPMHFAGNECYVVQNETTKDVYDVDGLIPDPASAAIRVGLTRK